MRKLKSQFTIPIQASKVGETHIAASWCERGIVYVWDLTTPLHVVNDAKTLANYHKTTKSDPIKPIYTFNGHGVEGFAMDWSPTVPGMFNTGVCCCFPFPLLYKNSTI